MNRASYDRLPRDLKNVIDSNSGLGVAAMAGAMWDIQAAAVANMVAERGDLIVTLLPEAVARWRKAAEPVLDAWHKETKERKIDGAKLVLAAHALLIKYASEPAPQQTPSAGQQAAAQSPQESQPKNTPISNSPRPPSATASSGKSAAAPPSQPAPQPPPKVAAPAPANPSQNFSPPGSPAAPAGPAAPAAKPLAAPVASTSAPASTPLTAASPPAAAPAAPTGAPAPMAAAPVAAPPATAAPAGPVAPLAPKPLANSLDIRL
jgi:hypothetical protein